VQRVLEVERKVMEMLLERSKGKEEVQGASGGGGDRPKGIETEKIIR